MREKLVFMPRDGHCLFTCLLHILICLIYLQSFEKVTISTREIFLIPTTGSIDQVHLVKNQSKAKFIRWPHPKSEFITNNVQKSSGWLLLQTSVLLGL